MQMYKSVHANKVGKLRPVSKNLASELERYNSKQAADEPRKHTRENWTICGLVATAVFTFALAGFSAWQVCETRRAYDPIEEFVDAANIAAAVGNWYEMKAQRLMTMAQIRANPVRDFAAPMQ